MSLDPDFKDRMQLKFLNYGAKERGMLLFSECRLLYWDVPWNILVSGKWVNHSWYEPALTHYWRTSSWQPAVQLTKEDSCEKDRSSTPAGVREEARKCLKNVQDISTYNILCIHIES